MSKRFLLLLTALTATSAMASEVEPLDEYSTNLQEIHTMCPSCELVAREVTESLNRECGLPLTKDNTQYIVNTHPVYIYSVAALSMIDNSETKAIFLKALRETVSCWNSSQWIEASKNKMDKDLIALLTGKPQEPEDEK